MNYMEEMNVEIHKNKMTMVSSQFLTFKFFYNLETLFVFFMHVFKFFKKICYVLCKVIQHLKQIT
jgi:hypothetical protein